MDHQDFYKLQHQLHSSNSRNKQLLQQNFALANDNNRLKQRVNELQTLVNNQPIHLIRQQLDPLALGNSLIQLQDKVNAQAYQISFFKQLIQDKSILLAQAQTQKNQLQLALQGKDLELSLLKHQIKEGGLREDKAKKEVEMWKNKLEKANQQRLKILNEKEDLSKRLKKQQNKNQSDLSQLGRDVIAIKDSAGKQNTKSKSSPKNILQQVLTLQQNELHDRNHQIAKLKSINGNYGQSNEVQHLKNTIKHLRGQITRYSSIIHHVNEKLALAEATVEGYSQSAEKCLQERAAYAEMTQKLDKLHQKKELQEKLIKKTEEWQKEKKTRIQLKKNLVQVLSQNQSYHQFLYQTFGQDYDKLLKDQIKHYNDRYSRRFAENRWGTINELIRVNEKLRGKLRMS